jgi:hypothetical protein
MFEVINIVRDDDEQAVAIIEFHEHVLTARGRSPHERFVALDSRQIAGGVDKFLDRVLTFSPEHALVHRNYKRNGGCYAL